jgi:pimeloyl-ACP methyl ester carboxylesterase
MTTVSPHLLFVPGAWHGPWAWTPLLPYLPRYDSHLVDLRSTGSQRPANDDLSADTAAVLDAIDAVSAEHPDAPLTVIAHSYGGLPATQAIAAAQSTGVRIDRIVYVGAFKLPVGASVLSSVGGTAPSWWIADADGQAYRADRPEEIFYHDVLPTGRASQAAGNLRPQSTASFAEPVSAELPAGIPRTYVILDQDRAIPVAAQVAMARGAQRQRHLDTAHAPFLSRPADLAELIREA